MAFFSERSEKVKLYLGKNFSCSCGKQFKLSNWLGICWCAHSQPALVWVWFLSEQAGVSCFVTEL